jgi:hypothetical protein
LALLGLKRGLGSFELLQKRGGFRGVGGATEQGHGWLVFLK